MPEPTNTNALIIIALQGLHGALVGLQHGVALQDIANNLQTSQVAIRELAEEHGLDSEPMRIIASAASVLSPSSMTRRHADALKGTDVPLSE